ncbi:hypothetical protein MMC20_002058 [Loxospora ochrophaea]|nr:hypothetical protein [Loxospora ochrophaea]
MVDRVRLHIRPLNPELLPVLIPDSLLPAATNISYHTLQTFPENNFGYVELPRMEGEKMKKKLHGSILKGSKVRVEEARPEKRTKRSREDSGLDREEHVEKKAKKAKRKQKEEGVSLGIELPKERKIKRGWTEPQSSTKAGKVKKTSKDKKARKEKVQPASLTEKSECLFRTKLPSNVNADKPKNGKAVKNKKGSTNRDVVVHEFSHTSKHPSFLRAPNFPNSKTTSEYVEGKGWVDGDGRVVEAPTRFKGTLAEPNDQATLQNHKSSSGSSSDESGSRQAPRVNDITKVKGPPNDPDETSSSGTSDSESDSDHEGYTSKSEAENITEDVHPLEALFKRPEPPSPGSLRKVPALEVRTSFSFFDDNSSHANPDIPQVPHTPFTQRDFQQRRLRSAAPTPDTAAPHRASFGNIWEGGEEDEKTDEDHSDNKDESNAIPSTNVGLAVGGLDSGERPQSEFVKWFYEHRGENNRAWKRRRREAAKEQRQQANKRRSGRNAF